MIKPQSILNPMDMKVYVMRRTMLMKVAAHIRARCMKFNLAELNNKIATIAICVMITD